MRNYLICDKKYYKGVGVLKDINFIIFRDFYGIF